MSEIFNPNPNPETSHWQTPKEAREVTASSGDGHEVIRAMYESPSLMEQPVEELKGLDALESKIFIDTTNLRQKNLDLIVNAQDYKKPIQIPLDLVVGAASFANWKGRHKGVTKTISTDEGYQSLPSIDVIKRYAAMDPATRPTIPEFDMFIQPDGKTFFSNSNDGSHRLASAIFNGEKTIPTLSLRVRYIEDTIF